VATARGRRRQRAGEAAAAAPSCPCVCQSSPAVAFPAAAAAATAANTVRHTTLTVTGISQVSAAPLATQEQRHLQPRGVLQAVLQGALRLLVTRLRPRQQEAQAIPLLPALLHRPRARRRLGARLPLAPPLRAVPLPSRGRLPAPRLRLRLLAPPGLRRRRRLRLQAAVAGTWTPPLRPQPLSQAQARLAPSQPPPPRPPPPPQHRTGRRAPSWLLLGPLLRLQLPLLARLLLALPLAPLPVLLRVRALIWA
jgi:hypothetical protein